MCSYDFFSKVSWPFYIIFVVPRVCRGALEPCRGPNWPICCSSAVGDRSWRSAFSLKGRTHCSTPAFQCVSGLREGLNWLLTPRKPSKIHKISRKQSKKKKQRKTMEIHDGINEKQVKPMRNPWNTHGKARNITKSSAK